MGSCCTGTVNITRFCLSVVLRWAKISLAHFSGRSRSALPKDTHFRWKIKWQLEVLGALRIMGEITSCFGLDFALEQICSLTSLIMGRRRGVMTVGSKMVGS